MTIWGHDEVYIEKDTEKKEWRVYVEKTRAFLVAVPFVHAFSDFPYAPDYNNAVQACQSDPDLALTAREEREVLLAIAREEEQAKKAKEQAKEPPKKAVEAARVDTNVFSLDAFRRKKR